MRRAFGTPQGYTCFEVSRADVLQGSQRAQAAVVRLGPVPHDILAQERQPSFKPENLNALQSSSLPAVLPILVSPDDAEHNPALAELG